MRTVLGRLLLIVLIALTPGLLLQLNAEWEARQTRERLMQEEALRLVSLVAEEQQRILDGAEQALTVIGSAAVVMDRQPDLCRQMVTNLVRASPRYLTAGATGNDGHFICVPFGFAPNIDLSDRPYYRDAQSAGGLAVGTYAIGHTTGQKTLHLAKAFYNADGTTGGVALVGLSLDWLATQLATVPLPPGAAVSIRDRNGTLLARYPSLPDAVGAAGLPEEIGTPHGSTIVIATYAWSDGTHRLTAYAPAGAGAQGLRIAVGLDPKTTFDAITRSTERSLTLILGAALLALAATTLLGARFIRRPVRQLLAVADRWRAGDLSARSGIARPHDEFGRLAAAFDAMAAARQARDTALRDSEAEHRAIFEQASVGMAQLSLDGTVRRANDALCAITGYSRDELIGWNFRAFTHPDDLATDDAQIRAVLGGAMQAATAEKRYIRKNGNTVWISRWGSLLRDRAGEPARLVTIVEDISARKAAQSALEDSERRLQLAREAAGFGVWDWSADTGTAAWSDQLFRLYGMQPRDTRVDLDTWRAAIHPGDRISAEAAIAAAIANPAQPFDATFRIVRPDGVTRWLHGKATVLRDGQGKATRVVGLTMDVTEAHETEAALRRLTAELEVRVQTEVQAREAAQLRAAHAERMQALGQLAGGIAHDFNNILQMVLSASSLIEEEPGDEKLVFDMAQLITEAADRGTATTNRLLSMGRQGALQAKPLDVTATLIGLRDIFVRTLGASIQVALRIDDGLPRMLADKAQLETALVNLGTNARDAMPRGGRIALSATLATVGSNDSPPLAELAHGAYVRLAVMDTGSGMDATTLVRVGQPFFTTKKAGAGTGLGLAMVRSFADRSGGGLTIDSVQGIGTTVALWLPVADAGSPDAHVPPPRMEPDRAAGLKHGGGTTRLLLVDDEAPVRHVLALQLTRKGFDVAVASGAMEALAMIEMGMPVDGLITDLAMPGMDGVSLIQTVHKRHPGLPAVLLTGYAEEGDGLAIEAAVSGACTLLRKPVTGQQLADRMADLLSPQGGAVARDAKAETHERAR